MARYHQSFAIYLTLITRIVALLNWNFVILRCSRCFCLFAIMEVV